MRHEERERWCTVRKPTQQFESARNPSLKHPVCSQFTINNLQGHDVCAKRNQLCLGGWPRRPFAFDAS
jgi:hypothetical protein